MPSTASKEDIENVADVQMGLFWDVDAASGDREGTLVGLLLISRSREEKELIAVLRQTLEELDKEGILRREGKAKAVCFIGCKGVDGIWVYGGKGEEMEGADLRVRGRITYLNALI